MNYFFFWLFRLLFGLSLVGLGLKTAFEINKIEPFVTQTIDQFQHKVLKKDFNISHLKNHSSNIVYVECFSLIAGGLFVLFGFKLNKMFVSLAVIVELSLIHNVFFYKEPKHILYASTFLAVLGASLNII